MAWAIIGVTAITAISSGAKIHAANKAAGRAEDLAIEAKKEEDAQKALLKIEMDKYKSHKFVNPYANMENVYEDLTVNQQQAQFQAQQGSQTRANVMQGLRGAAGGSGIAGLAQAMANQGQLQTQQISASIGQQEARNQRLAAQGAGQVQSMERQGDAMVQSAEMGRIKTLIGMQQASTAGAMDYSNQADAYQMQADNALTSAWSSGIADTIGAGIGAYTGGLSKKSGRGSMPGSTGPMESLGPELLPIEGIEIPDQLSYATYPGKTK